MQIDIAYYPSRYQISRLLAQHGFFDKVISLRVKRTLALVYLVTFKCYSSILTRRVTFTSLLNKSGGRDPNDTTAQPAGGFTVRDREILGLRLKLRFGIWGLGLWLN